MYFHKKKAFLQLKKIFSCRCFKNKIKLNRKNYPQIFFYLVDQGTSVLGFFSKDKFPKFKMSSFNKITCLWLIETMFITNFNQFLVTFASFVSNISKMWISRFTILPHFQTVIKSIVFFIYLYKKCCGLFLMST